MNFSKTAVYCGSKDKKTNQAFCQLNQPHFYSAYNLNKELYMFNLILLNLALASGVFFFLYRSLKVMLRLKDSVNLARIKRKNKSKAQHLAYLRKGNYFGNLNDSYALLKFKSIFCKVSSQPSKVLNKSAYNNITF